MDDCYEWEAFEAFEDEEDCDDDCRCAGCLFSDNTSDTSDYISDCEEEPGDPIQVEHTRKLRAQLEGKDLTPALLNIISAIKAEGLNLPLFLDAVCYGYETPNATIRYARTSLLVSEELPAILERCLRPPRTHNKGKRPVGAKRSLEQFSVRCVKDLIQRDMEKVSVHFLSPPEELTQEHLTSFDFAEFIELVKSEVPLLWDFLDHTAYSQKQRARNSTKGSDMVTLQLLSQSQYTRSHRRGRITKLWALYLKACGLSARAFDALHALGVVMSHKWTANAYGDLSRTAMDEARLEIQRSPWIISHDNVNIPMRVFSQRLHNQSHFISGCAATIWVLPREALLPPDTNLSFQQYRADKCGEPFSYGDVLDGDPVALARIKKRHIYHVLQILLQSPDFVDYASRNHDLFKPPPPVRELPCGPEYTVKQFILGTADIEEASYEGNDKVVAEWFRQGGLDSEEEKKKTGMARVIPWIGDQMTVERLRGLWRYRHEEFNSFDRMDYLIPVFGWFHLVMAFANSLHKQYLGTSAGIGGLQQAFDVLQRKGLQKAETKGPFWHHLDEALHHVSEAHLRACWLAVGKVKSLTDLKTKSPRDLYDLAVKLVDENASRKAIARLEHLPESNRDHVKRQFTMFNHDVLVYIELTDAIRNGDVGRMEDLLPILLMRFGGGGNSKYTIEMLELLQGLRREWPEVIRNHVRDYCWLINRSGKRSGFLPIDQGQEQNIRDIKVTYHSFGPGATWAYLHKVSPAIPTLRALQRHMDSEFETITRGARHGVPQKELDVTKLTDQYVKSGLHVYDAGRQIKSAKNKAEDFLTKGVVDLERLGTIDTWWKSRSYARFTSQDWNESTQSLAGQF
ncbi:hypothetical protein BV22DRAFT_1166000 [Leucogyrophana mollusca]|uniref:Uncharacterized protein n=1 Tax=Leucogyrophana mollusca TaxID=85980 RepID=A0ACB8BEJ5_9AGAM|nr:hypothetical protein BV22DRAFT_1166000 [Leucogyrophana mollusca]